MLWKLPGALASEPAQAPGHEEQDETDPGLGEKDAGHHHEHQGEADPQLLLPCTAPKEQRAWILVKEGTVVHRKFTNYESKS